MANGQVITTLESQFGRLTYTFADKYIITGTVRRDGSSKFDVGHKYGVFPSGAVAWKVKEKSFMQSVDWLFRPEDQGQLGRSGQPDGNRPLSIRSPVYVWRATQPEWYGRQRQSVGQPGYPFNKIYQTGIAQSQPANPDLKWETDKQTDIGVDLAFLHRRPDLHCRLVQQGFKRLSADAQGPCTNGL